MGADLGSLLASTRHRTVGLDPSGSQARPSGWALMEGLEVKARLLRSDAELIELTAGRRPELVAIDAPLSWPEEGYMREVDRLMHKAGLPVLPPLFPAMRALTARGIRLAEALRSLGLEVIEVHPASTRKVLGLPVKNRRAVQEALIDLGLRGDVEDRELSMHELDAVTAALTAYIHLLGLSEVIRAGDGEIYVPRRDVRWRTRGG